MWDYSEKVLELFYHPRNQGVIENLGEAGIQISTGEVGSIACGDALRLHLKIEVASDQILDARFQTFGCTSAIASSSALTEMIKGLSLDQALKISNQEIATYLGGLPEAKMHCSVMGQEALEAAIFNYRGIPIETHDEDEGALVCSCFGITKTRIQRVIQENHLTTPEQVTNYVKAGGGCGSCLVAIEDAIEEVQQDLAAKGSPPAPPSTIASPDPSAPADPHDPEIEIPVVLPTPSLTTPSSQPEAPRRLTTVQKIALIQQVIDEEVRPVLIADGGDVELYDVEGDHVQVYLKGACGSCPSSTATLKTAIEARLRDRVLPSLIVESV